MLRLFLYREFTGESFECISESSELAAELDLGSMPDPSVLSRTWRERFDEATREFVETATLRSQRQLRPWLRQLRN